MPEEEPEAMSTGGLSIGEVYYLLFRRKRLIMIFALLGVLAAGIIYLRTPAIYLSEAKLLVRYIAEATPVAADVSGDRVISTLSRGSDSIRTEVEILSSPGLALKVVERIGVERMTSVAESGLTHRIKGVFRWVGARFRGGDEAAPSDRRRPPAGVLASDLIRNLSIDVPKNSNILRLFYRARSAELAQEVLSTLIAEYMVKHIEVHRASGAYEFLSQQTDQLRVRLSETEAELRTLKKATGIASVDEANAVVVARIQELSKALRDAETSLAGARARIGVLQEAAPSAPAANADRMAFRPADETLANALDALRRLRQREMEMLATYTADSLPVQSVRKQIEAVKQIVDARTAEGADTNQVIASGAQYSEGMLNDLATVASLEAAIKILTNHLAEARSDAEKLDEAEDRIVQLERRRSLEGANYRYFAERLEKARIDDALDASKIENIGIVQAATRPNMSIRPKLWRNMMMALLTGLFGGIGMAFLVEHILDRSLSRPSQVESVLQAPLLIAIPDTMTANRQLPAGANRTGPRLLPAHAAGGPEEPAPSDRPQDQHQESGERLYTTLKPYFEALRDRVLSQLDPEPEGPQILGITSCLEGSGVTTTAFGLAKTFACNDDGRVLFIDAAKLDFMAANQLLGSGSSAGVMHIETDDHGHMTVVQPNLFVLSAAEVGEDFPRMTLARGFERLMNFARQSEYRFVVFDLPPVDDTSMALRIAPFLDGVVLIIEAERVRADVAEKAKQLLARSGAKLIGTVLNKQHAYVPNWLHQAY